MTNWGKVQGVLRPVPADDAESMTHPRIRLGLIDRTRGSPRRGWADALPRFGRGRIGPRTRRRDAPLKRRRAIQSALLDPRLVGRVALPQWEGEERRVGARADRVHPRSGRLID